MKNPKQQVTFGNFVMMENGKRQTGLYLNCDEFNVKVDTLSDIEKLFKKSGGLWYNIHPKTFKAKLFNDVYPVETKLKSSMTDLEFLLPLLEKSNNNFKCLSKNLYNANPTEEQFLRNVQIR